MGEARSETAAKDETGQIDSKGAQMMSFIHRTATIQILPKFKVRNPADFAYEFGTVALIVLLLATLSVF